MATVFYQNQRTSALCQRPIDGAIRTRQCGDKMRLPLWLEIYYRFTHSI